MATPSVAPPPQKPRKIPATSPYQAPDTVCPNRDCHRILHPQVGKNAEGGLALIYICEPCGYASVVAPPHIYGQEIPITNLGRKGWPSIDEKGA